MACPWRGPRHRGASCLKKRGMPCSAAVRCSGKNIEALRPAWLLVRRGGGDVAGHARLIGLTGITDEVAPGGFIDLAASDRPRTHSHTAFHPTPPHGRHFSSGG